MAATFTIDQSGDSALNVALASGWFIIGGSIVFSGSYTATGEVINLAKAIGSGGSLRKVIVLGNVRGMDAEYNRATGRLRLWIPTTVATGAIQEMSGAYDADLTATPCDVAFLVKFG